MINKLIVFSLCMTFVFSAYSQKYFTKSGDISFFSSTPIENIEATSNSASSVFDLSSGKIQWAVLIKSFEFEKALMQEHFNENYMESSKYPKAKFSGAISNIEELDLTTNGTYPLNINGILNIHGVDKEVNASAVFEIDNGVITGGCTLKIAVADFGIDIPSVVKDNIAKELEIRIKALYEILDK